MPGELGGLPHAGGAPGHRRREIGARRRRCRLVLGAGALSPGRPGERAGGQRHGEPPQRRAAGGGWCQSLVPCGGQRQGAFPKVEGPGQPKASPSPGPCPLDPCGARPLWHPTAGMGQTVAPRAGRWVGLEGSGKAGLRAGPRAGGRCCVLPEHVSNGAAPRRGCGVGLWFQVTRSFSSQRSQVARVSARGSSGRQQLLGRGTQPGRICGDGSTRPTGLVGAG